MRKLVLLLMICLMAVVSAQAATITLQPGPDEGMDTTVLDYVPDRNFHDSYYNYAGSTDGVINFAALIKFDLSAPQFNNVTFTSATLSLYGSGVGKDMGVSAAMITEDWVQDVVTYNTMPSMTTDSQYIASGMTYDEWGWTDFDVTKMANAWLDTNYGAYLLADDNYMYYYSSNYGGQPELRPKLTLEFQESGPKTPEPMSLSLILTGLVGLIVKKRSA